MKPSVQNFDELTISKNEDGSYRLYAKGIKNDNKTYDLESFKLYNLNLKISDKTEFKSAYSFERKVTLELQSNIAPDENEVLYNILLHGDENNISVGNMLEHKVTKMKVVVFRVEDDGYYVIEETKNEDWYLPEKYIHMWAIINNIK